MSLGEVEAEGGRPVLGPMEAGRLASLEGSLFESLLALLDRLRGDMIGRLLDTVMRDVREKAQLYRQDRSVRGQGPAHSLFDLIDLVLDGRGEELELCSVIEREEI